MYILVSLRTVMAFVHGRALTQVYTQLARAPLPRPPRPNPVVYGRPAYISTCTVDRRDRVAIGFQSQGLYRIIPFRPSV